MEVFVTAAIARKLKERHNAREHEVVECFRNLKNKYATDTRPDHQTVPPTLWFIGETNGGQRLKVIFIRYSKKEFVVKSAYEPNCDEERLYQMYIDRG
jgi:hypothetical protein